MDRTKNGDYKSAFFTLLLAAATIFISIYFFPAIIILPAAMSYSLARNGYCLGSAVIICCLIVAYIISPAFCLFVSLLFLPAAFVSAYMIRSRTRFFNSVLAASGASMIGILLIAGAIWVFEHMLPAEYITGLIIDSIKSYNDQGVKLFYNLFRSADIISGAITQSAVDATLPGEAIEIMRIMIKDSVNTIFVSLAVIFSLSAGLLSITLPISRAKKHGIQTYDLPSFCEYRLPNRFWLVFIISYVVAIIGANLGVHKFDILEITLFNVFSFLFMIQGLSLLDFFYKKKRMGNITRVVLHLITSLIGGLVLTVIGLVENISNLRRRLERRDGHIS